MPRGRRLDPKFAGRVTWKPASSAQRNPNNPYANLTPQERWNEIVLILAEVLPRLFGVTPPKKLETPGRIGSVDGSEVKR